MDSLDRVVPIAEVVPLFPPRPDAIVTMLTSDDFLAGAQTLLYSIQKSLPKPSFSSYPPEIVVMVTPNVSTATREALFPIFCSRVREVESISFPASDVKSKQTEVHVQSWSEHGELTKLNIFRFENYDTLLYLDADCLVLKDVSSLLDLGKIYQSSEALVAAAADIFPPDKFNAGVLVIRPSEAIFDDMMQKRSELSTYDGGDTGFLNSYFPSWYSEMPPFARLPFGFNAQRFLFHCTHEKQPNYWDLAVAPNLHIIHFSSSPKPWESKSSPSAEVSSVRDHLTETDIKTLQRLGKSTDLESLWWKWYNRSKNHCSKVRSEMQKPKSPNPIAKKVPPDPKAVHKQIVTRYKKLRQEGKTTKEAMMLSRREFGLDEDAVDATAAVAAMFGIGGS